MCLVENSINPNQYYVARAILLAGSHYVDVYHQAKTLFKVIEKRTKRKPYIRSAYFGKQKIFFDYFWIHLSQKNISTRKGRLKFFAAAIELVEKSRQVPTSKVNPEKRSEILHRFLGRLRSGEIFAVQVKENVRTHSKQLMSVFSLEK